MKKFCESLRARTMEIIIFKKKNMNVLKNKQQKSYRNPKHCCIGKEELEDKHAKEKKYCKVRDQCHYAGKYRGTAQSICNLRYSVRNN